MKRFPILLAGVVASALCPSSPALAQDGAGDTAQTGAKDCRESGDCIVFADFVRADILVSANRLGGADVPEHYPGSVSVITADKLEARQTREIAEVLRDVPGVAVSVLAGQTQIRLRGTEANHVLVLVDGIEVADPASGEFDLGLLAAEIGSRIEVLRGPQSALYGSEAIGGVVAYESDRFSGLGARIEAGSRESLNAAARWGIDTGDHAASLSAVALSTDGAPNARGGTRKLGRDVFGLAFKGALVPADGVELRAVLRGNLAKGDFNEQDFNPSSPSLGLVIDSPGVGYRSRALYGLLGARLSSANERWIHDFSVQFADFERRTFNAFARTSDTASDRFKASYVLGHEFGGGAHQITFAADYEEEGFNNRATFDARRSARNIGLVGEYRHSGALIDLDAAIRHDFNNRFADATSFRLGAGAWLGDATRLRAAVGTGIKNPSFVELYGFFDGVFVGNSALEPEQSTSWEIGIDQEFLGGGATLALTYFNARLEKEIVTSFPPPDFVQTPVNAPGKSKQSGIELALSARLGAGFSLDAAYSYLDATENGLDEVRRPDHAASLALDWRAPQDAASLTLVVRYNGEASDLAFTDPSFVPRRVRLGDYTLVNLNARMKLTPGLEAFGRLENLLDERYEPVFSFVAPGRSALVGIAARF